MITAANFYFLLLTTLIVVNFVALLIALYMFFWVRRLVAFSKQSIIVEGEVAGGVAEKLSKVGEESLNKIINEHAKALNNQTAQYFTKINKAASANISDLSLFLKKQENLVIKQSEYAVERLIAKTVEEIEQYKEYQMRRVDEESASVIEKVIKEVLARAITVEEQEELVREALKSAKAEGLFDRTTRPKAVFNVPKVVSVAKNGKSGV